MHTVNRGAALVAVALALAGCGGGSDDNARPAGELAPNVVQPGAPGQGTRTLTPAELAALPATTFTEADVRFVQGMVHHHAQALQLTGLVPARSGRKDIGLLARRMEISQEAELELMRRWLRERGRAVPGRHRAHGGPTLMPGMLSEAELRRLGAARGDAFDRLFLRFMIRHHVGATTMVARLVAGDGGNEPEVSALARHVDADQQVEIARMRGLLAGL